MIAFAPRSLLNSRPPFVPDAPPVCSGLLFHIIPKPYREPDHAHHYENKHGAMLRVSQTSEYRDLESGIVAHFVTTPKRLRSNMTQHMGSGPESQDVHA